MRERMPGINRQVYRLLGQLKLTNGIGSVATLFQLGPRGRALKLHRNPEFCGCYAATGQVESLLGVLDDLENYSVIDNLAPQQGFPPICTIWGLKNRSSRPRRDVANSTLHPARQEWLPDCGHLLMERPDRSLNHRWVPAGCRGDAGLNGAFPRRHLNLADIVLRVSREDLSASRSSSWTAGRAGTRRYKRHTGELSADAESVAVGCGWALLR
jgi:hypothetical protein